MEKTYYYCRNCGNIVSREIGRTYGDGQVDTDKSPVYLHVGTPREAVQQGIDVNNIMSVCCGCND